MRSLALLALFAASVCRAEPSITELLLDRIDRARLVQTRSAVLVHVIGGPRAGLYRIADGALGEQLATPDGLETIRPFGTGFIAARALARSGDTVTRWQVVRFDGRTARSTVIYETPPDTRQFSMEPALSADGVYVLHLVAERHSVRRIASTGKTQWEVDLGPGWPFAALSIPGGVLLQRTGDAGPWNLAAFDDAGKMLWERRTDSFAAVEGVFLPPARAALLHSFLHGEPPRITFIDVRNGKEVTAVVAERWARLRPTFDGMLLATTALNQPYVTRLKSDGTHRWSQRLPFDGRTGSTLLDAAVTSAGELWVLGKADDFYVGGRLQIRPLTLLRTSAKRPAAVRACLAVDPKDIEDPLRELREYYIAVETEYPPPGATGPCPSPTAPEYRDFLREFVAALREGIGNNGHKVQVVIDAAVPSFERRLYDEDFVNPCGIVGCGPSVVYAANPRAGRVLAEHLNRQVIPHLVSMEKLRHEFRSMISETVQIRSSGHEHLSDPELFAALRSNFATVLRELARRLISGLAERQRERGQEPRYITLTPDSFGEHSQPRPIAELDTTLQQLYPPRSAASQR